MGALEKLRGAYAIEIRRNPAIKRLARREHVPVVALVVAIGCCCLLLMAVCYQDVFGYGRLMSLREMDQMENADVCPAPGYGRQSASRHGIATGPDSESTALSDGGRVFSADPPSHEPKHGRLRESAGYDSDHPADRRKGKSKYIEVLGNKYKPQPVSMPSWLPKIAQDNELSSGKQARITSESRMILASNKAVAPHTAEPDGESLLILTPVKNNAKHLARYFALIDKLKYPREKMSIAFLVSDSTDETQQMLVESRQWYQERAPAEMRFKRFEIYRQDFFFALPRNQRHLRERQKERRTMMARARNYLWTRALQSEQWVLWIDGDLEYYPPNIVRDLMAYDKDVIVPNCLVRKKTNTDQWKHTVYDRNAWQETKKSLEMISRLKEEDFLVEGYKSLNTHRKYLDNFSRNETIVPLDGVGGTFTLLKAHVHRSGVGFPAWLFQHQVETEGFAKLAKANGFGVYGLPFYYIRHVVG